MGIELKISLKRTLIISFTLLLLVLVCMHFYQKTHFNKNISINSVKVGGLTAQQAYSKVRKTDRTSRIYLNDKIVYTGKPTNSGFKTSDKRKFVQALHRQYTFFPSHQYRNLLVEPAHLNKKELTNINYIVNKKINMLNAHRIAPQDAYALYQNNQVKIIPAVNGTQYSKAGIYQKLSAEFVNGTVHLTLKKKQPVSAHSRVVRNERKQLLKLKHRKVDYQVQNKTYHFKTSDVISKATYQDGKYTFDTTKVAKQIQQINHQEATLGKSFKFKDSDGQLITTSNQGTYGWKISSTQAGNSIAQALAANKKNISAENDIYGKGYSHLGTGYGVTTNDGIGNTYVAVSLEKQHAWFYQHGKCVLSTDIVSGSDNKDNHTPKGVWYIMYQQSPSTLRGFNDDGSRYASKVQYWSPFTLSGCGFHDASWRTDWSKTAYKQTNGGSHGCINMHPENAGEGFRALSKGEPVIIY